MALALLEYGFYKILASYGYALVVNLCGALKFL